MERETAWSERALEAVGWMRRVVFGESERARIEFVEDLGEVATGERPTVAVLFGQWPGRLPGELVLADPVDLGGLEEIVRSVAGRVGRAPNWWLHGLDSLPGRLGSTARRIVRLARVCGGGRVIVDLRGMAARDRARLRAQVRRWKRLGGGASALDG